MRSGYLGFVGRLGWNGETIRSLDFTAHHDVSVTPSGEPWTPTECVREVPSEPPGLMIIDQNLALLSPDGEFLEEL